MSDIAIRVAGLGKLYHIGALQEMRGRLGDRIVESFTSPFRRAFKLMRGQVETAEMLEEDLWALEDINFEIRHGEAVGVIGANGAGKSTLLKILSQITAPTQGTVDIYGRVGSLLEVGTGFHPELTGRENIFLNGAILGMRKKEVQRKFDEIVAFSAIEKFIDTPIKHYSSGMYVRLAFSVAAHLEPEILLVDEVLAVGDIEFQKRCLGKMEDVTSAGRTVLFVSHNMGLVQALCQRGIFLRNGRLSSDTSVTDAVKDYLRSFSQNMHLSLSDRTDRVGNGEYRLTGIQILDSHQIDTRSIVSGEPVRFAFTVNEVAPRMFISFTVYDFIGRAIARFQSSVASEVDVIDPQLGCQFICEIDHLLLTPGNYRLDVELRITGRLEDEIQSAATIDVHEGSYEGRRILALKGVNTFIPHRWHSPLKYHNL